MFSQIVTHKLGQLQSRGNSEVLHSHSEDHRLVSVKFLRQSRAESETDLAYTYKVYITLNLQHNNYQYNKSIFITAQSITFKVLNPSFFLIRCLNHPLAGADHDILQDVITNCPYVLILVSTVTERR